MLPGAEDADSAREAADAHIWSNVVRALQIDLKPGEGPSEAELAAGSFEMIFVGRAASGQEISTPVAGEGDPYALTPRNVAECEVCLTQNGTTATRGAWNAAAPLGEPLRPRPRPSRGMLFARAKRH